ncbi:EAL and HDOD domain-containing protein [Nitrosomonas mobilis]|uniref:Diguanylate phosphodiesterase n=1 Tax=Nitrosomonas mobilis TaxID=51642 RepID=A0A1G5SFN7_9PROT|nr:HDOD domain-containing protein [Nitrosomonas mobilis]SCZ86015.1 Diguanylate phosphodiesterase [Nitrosomonas mobilis]HNO75336.1 HDOD domain-containing protein [Nitrosomonas mobilis]
MDNIFLGRQPILDRQQNLVAYELLFRPGQVDSVHVADNVNASANVLVNAYGQLGIQRVLGNQRGFINVNQELLLSDAILLLPHQHVVLELLESIVITPEIVQRCLDLKQKGYHLALDDVTTIDERLESLLPIVNVVKVDVLALTDAAIEQLITRLKRWPVVLLAEKVENPVRARLCMDLGFELFQGFFFAKPEIVSGKQIEPSNLSMLQLLSLVMQDGEIEKIEQLLKHQPGLSYNLLRMVNSVAGGLPQKVGSIKQAVMVLGYQQLQRWVQLLLYAVNSSGENNTNALMQTAAIRGRLMELIAAMDRPHDKSYQDRAFMTGIMSLLDALLGMNIQEVVDKLEMPEEMTRALLKREGRLGQQLLLVEASENNDLIQVDKIIVDLGFLDTSALTHAELSALEWAGQIDQ